MSLNNELKVHALEWTGNSVKVLDQRVLPETIRFDEYSDASGVAEAIKTMRVRGAPAIGIAAAYAVALSVMQHYSSSAKGWEGRVLDDIQQLANSRPTAVNLFWALQTKFVMSPLINAKTKRIRVNGLSAAILKQIGCLTIQKVFLCLLY